MFSDAAALEIRRAADPAYEGDGPEAAFALLADGARRGIGGALITIVGTEGGAPRALGSHMAVLADGAYCGYVSGGCVEAAIAAEAIEVLRSGKDAVLRFGLGSRFIDIRLPCGGGIDLHVHVDPDPALVENALDALSRRRAFALDLAPEAGTSSFVADSGTGATSTWAGKVFRRHYQPKTRLVLIGQGPEFEATLRLARGADFDLAAFSPDAHSLRLAANHGIPATPLTGLADAPDLPVDPWTAVVFMFHDHDWETALLLQALASPAFFIGALGSRATHAGRCVRLREKGIDEAALERIHGPIGLFGPTRDATSLAVSTLAQIVEERRALGGS